MKKVLSVYLRPYYGRMLIGFIIKFFGTIMDLCLPWILAYMIDSIIPQREKGRIYLWGIVMLICSILALTLNVFANRMASKVARDTTETIRHDLFERILWLSNAKTDAFTKPSLISRLTTDTYNVHQSAAIRCSGANSCGGRYSCNVDIGPRSDTCIDICDAADNVCDLLFFEEKYSDVYCFARIY